MRVLNRYIGRHVLLGSLLALAVLVAIDLAFAFAAEANDIGEGQYDLGKSILYVILTAPRRAYDFLPMASIVGSLVMLGTLASGSEFIAMRSAGVSIGQIARAILRAGLVLVVLALILSEAITPFTEPYAQQMRSFAQTQSTALKSRHGIWARDGLSFVNIRHIRPDGELHGLDIYEFNKDYKLKIVTSAAKAVFEENAWQLFDIEQTNITDEALENVRYDQARWGALLNPELISVLAVKPEQLAVWRLMTYIDYLKLNGLDTEPYQFALWRKLTSPLAILVMLFMSVPFIFSALRSTGAGQRTLIGIVVGIVYLLITHVMVSMGEVYNFNPVLSNIVPIFVFFMAGLVGLKLVR